MILLSDGYLANGSEPWRLPDVDALRRHRRRLRHRAEPRQRRRRAGVLALPPRPRDAGPPAGAARHARADAPHRRHREGGRHRQHQLRPEQPRAHGRPAGGQDRRHRPATSRRSRSWATSTTPSCSSSAGARPGAPSAAPSTGCAARGRKVAQVHLDAPQPVPAQPRRGPGPLPEGPGARDEPGPAQPRCCGPSSWSTPGRSPRCKGVPFTAGELETDDPGRPSMTDTAIPVTTSKDWSSDQEVRWCPGCGDYSILTAVQMLMPELGVTPREHRVRVGHRLRGPVPVLHEHLRHAQHPRAGPGHRHRPGHGPARPRRVGHQRRRRRAVDRRQPPDPRAAPQRRT